MSYALSTLRDKLRLKINQSSSGSNLVYENSELNGYINDGIKHIINFGRLQLIGASAYKRTTDAAADHLSNDGNGYATKPTDYLRFVTAKVDGKWIRRKIDFHEIEFIENNSLINSDTNIKYVCEVSGSELLIFPSTFSECELIYIAETTDLSSDSDSSPLTNTGDSYAIDWAYALALEAKGYKPELSRQIFARVNQVLGFGTGVAATGESGQLPGISPINPPPAQT